MWRTVTSYIGISNFLISRINFNLNYVNCFIIYLLIINDITNSESAHLKDFTSEAIRSTQPKHVG